MQSYGSDDYGTGMLLDPPDPVNLDPLDLLISHTEDSTAHRPRPLDFVRAKMKDLKNDNKRLRERVADLEQTLSIVQTAQEWTMTNRMSPEQAEKMRDIKGLLEQAKKAREDIQKFSEVSRQTLYEKLRACKNALRREREEKREMKERLMHAFDHARSIREQHRQLTQKRADEQEYWQDMVRDMKERHRRELKRLQGDTAAMESDRHDQLSHFGEQVIGELTALQQHLHEVRQETVTSVILEGEDLEDPALATSAGATGESAPAGGAAEPPSAGEDAGDADIADAAGDAGEGLGAEDFAGSPGSGDARGEGFGTQGFSDDFEE